MNPPTDPGAPSRGPANWIPAIVALGLLLALMASTASGGWAGHTPLLWFVLLTIVCVRLRAQSWVVVLYLPALALFALWFLGAAKSVTLPFGIGLLIAYLLDPVVDRLEKRMSRTTAIFVLAGPLVLILVLLGILLVPAVVGEGAQLVSRLPELQDPLERLGAWGQEQAARFGYTIERSTIADWIVPRLEAIGKSLLGAGIGVWRGVQGVISFVSFLVITPVVGFYLLRDIDRIREGFVAGLPKASQPATVTFFDQVDRAVSGYLRGQLLVGVIAGTTFAVGLSVMGIEYALLVGITSIVLNLIPYVGSFLTAILALAVGLLTEPSWMSIAKVGGVYAVAQGIDAVISPRIMGDSLSLHPVVVMLSVLIAGQFLGLVGVIVAVPAAAVLKEALVLWTPQLLQLLPLARDEESTDAT